MEKYSIFHIEGGIGKHVAATAVAKAIANNHKDRKLVIVCAWPEVFLNLPFVWRVYRIGTTPYFWEDYIKGGNSLIFKHEPYFTTEHINGKLDLIQNWCKLYGLKYKGELPEIKFNIRQSTLYSRKWTREKPIMVIQTNGGPLTEQPYPYSWTRDIPKPLAQAIVNQYKEDYHIIQICRNDANILEGVEVQKETMDNMELFYLLNMSSKRVLIDSCLQHAAVALNLPSVVLWVATNPKLFGYDIHNNIVANLDSQIPLPNSYLFDYNFHGQIWECPIFEGDILFNIDEIVQKIDNL
jgi:hypothetical protein